MRERRTRGLHAMRSTLCFTLTPELSESDTNLSNKYVKPLRTVYLETNINSELMFSLDLMIET